MKTTNTATTLDVDALAQWVIASVGDIPYSTMSTEQVIEAMNANRYVYELLGDAHVRMAEGLPAGSLLYLHPPQAASPKGGDLRKLLGDARHRIANLSRAKVPFDDLNDGPVFRRLDAALAAISTQDDTTGETR